jgi:hypothetical protein
MTETVERIKLYRVLRREARKSEMFPEVWITTICELVKTWMGCLQASVSDIVERTAMQLSPKDQSEKKKLSN